MKEVKLTRGRISFLIMVSLGLFYLFNFNFYDQSISGTIYVVNKASHSLTVFDLKEGKLIKEIPLKYEHHELAVLQNMNKIVVTNYGNENQIGTSLSIIDGTQNVLEKTIKLGKNSKPHGIASLPNSNCVLVCGDVDNALFVVNVSSGEVESKIFTKQYFSHLVVKNPIKNLAYVVNTSSESISVIDLLEKRVIENIDCGRGAQGFDVHPSGSEIWVANSMENTIFVIDANDFSVKKIIKTPDEPIRVKFTENGQKCVVTNVTAGSISIYDADSKSELKEIKIPGNGNFFDRLMHHTPRPVGIEMHPDGKYAFITNSNAHRVEVLDLEKLEIVSHINTGLVPDGIAVLTQKKDAKISSMK